MNGRRESFYVADLLFMRESARCLLVNMLPF